MTDANADFITDLDLALAALRRVIVRAHEAGAGKPVKSAVKNATGAAVVLYPPNHRVDAKLIDSELILNGVSVRLSRDCACLAEVLLRAAPNPVGHDLIRRKINIYDDSNLSVIVNTLRDAVAPLGLVVRVFSRLGIALHVGEKPK